MSLSLYGNIAEVPIEKTIAALVNAVQAGGSTRIYCSLALKTLIAATYAEKQKTVQFIRFSAKILPFSVSNGLYG